MEQLDEYCISLILSFTSPLDTCRASTVSSKFKSVVDSDILWNQLLPSDIDQILSRSNIFPLTYTRKQLYFFLADSYVLLDDGNMSFWLDKTSGKKCWMVGAKKPTVSWGDEPCFWTWATNSNSRLAEVAALKVVWWLDIRGRISNNMLSPDTTYEIYLIYRLAEHLFGFHIYRAKTLIRIVGEREDVPLDEANIVFPDTIGVGEVPSIRKDGWMEIKTGEYFNYAGIDDELETQFMAIEREVKFGLILQGIEFRPKKLQGVV